MNDKNSKIIDVSSLLQKNNIEETENIPQNNEEQDNKDDSIEIINFIPESYKNSMKKNHAFAAGLVLLPLAIDIFIDPNFLIITIFCFLFAVYVELSFISICNLFSKGEIVAISGKVLNSKDIPIIKNAPSLIQFETTNHQIFCFEYSQKNITVGTPVILYVNRNLEPESTQYGLKCNNYYFVSFNA